MKMEQGGRGMRVKHNTDCDYCPAYNYQAEICNADKYIQWSLNCPWWAKDETEINETIDSWEEG